MDNDPFDPLSLSSETSYFLEAYLMTCLADESHIASKEEIIEIQTNWQNVVKNGRNPDLKILLKGKEVPIKEAAQAILEKINTYVASISDQAIELKANLSKTLKLQQRKIEDPNLTPSGKILKTLKENDINWTEFNLEIFKEHKKYFSQLNKDLSYLEEEAVASIEKFNELEKEKEIPFADFLKNYLNALN